MPRLAHFCPESIDQARRDDPRYRAEVKFYDALGRQLPQGWHVLYDVGWLNRRLPTDALRDGQIDFIVAHPVHGALVIEVKGGGIRFDGLRQQWISTDSRGVDHDIKNPFKQARDSKYTLIEKLRELPNLKQSYVELHHAAAFPDCDRPSQKVNEEAYPEIIIGRQDMSRLADRLVEVAAHSRGRGQFNDGKAVVQGLEYLLCRSAKLENPLQTLIDEEQREMQLLTNSQINTIALLQRVRRVSLGGGAGSGKTYLAVFKAKDLAKQGFRTLLTCHSRPLATYLDSLASGVPNLRVATVHDIARDLVLDLASVSPDTDAAYPAMLFDEMQRTVARPFDAIVVDEGQDFTAEWWLALESCLVEGKTGVFYVFHDTNNQVLVPGCGALPDDMVRIDLEENVRNTQNICRALAPHYRGDVPIRPRGPGGRAVEYHAYSGEAELKGKLSQVLQRLLMVEGIRPNDIVVLTPRHPGVDSSLTRLGLPHSIRLVTDADEVRGRNVLCATIAEFKGLERSVVLVAELDERLNDWPKERAALLYVAFSRPRNLLVILHSQQASAWLKA
jgi:Nuclease-related domain